MRIAIVGVDGAGKTTQVHKLKEWLEAKGTVSVCKAQSLNRALVEEMQMEYKRFKEVLSVAMALDLAHTVKLDDPGSAYMIWDRYTYCVQAYFVAESIYNSSAQFILDQLPKPDLTIWIDSDPGVAAQRVLIRGQAKLLENEPFLKKVRQAYCEILRDEPNVIPVNGNLTPEEVHKEIIAAIGPLIEASTLRS